MFNLKKFKRQVVAAVTPPQDPQKVIAQIHNAFDTATDKILADAKAIIAQDFDTEKGERLKAVGFQNSKASVEAAKIVDEKKKSKELATLVEYYQTHYPNYKFVTEDVVKSICHKYGLLCAESSYYIGDVPTKNLADIEAFKLREEDMKKITHGHYKLERNSHFRPSMPNDPDSSYGYIVRDRFGEHFHYDSSKSPCHYEKEPLKICASVKDFNTDYLRIEDGYKLSLNLPDPIVLQPVKGGYLVVTKWGLEAEDNTLTNEKMN